MIASSADVGWTSLLLEYQRFDSVAEGETRVTPDQTLYMVTRGQLEFAVRDRGEWQTSLYQVGSAGLRPGSTATHLRLAAREPATGADVVHLFVPPRFFAEAADHYRRAGQSFRDEPLRSSGFNDPTVTHAVFAMLRAMEARVPDLYAETLAQWLATHLLSTHASWSVPTTTGRTPGVIADQRLARVVEYMSAHFAEPLSLECLARAAGVSKFHFAHLFRERTGLTPHGYLIQLRLDAARRLLATTDLRVSEIAASCGYDSPAHFGAAFQRRHGLSPVRFRRQQRSSFLAKE